MNQGSEAPDFTLPGLDGVTLSLREARDNGPMLLVFWQAHCGACKMVAPYLNRLNDAYEHARWTLWTIAQDGPEDARAFVREYGFRPTVLVDGPSLEVSDMYDPPATPTFYMLQPGAGVVTFVAEGFDKDALNDISRSIAAHVGAEYVEVAPEYDGNPRFRAG